MAKPKILVADDDPTVRRLLGNHLKRGGLEPILTEDGREALTEADESIAAALIDLEMPHVNGLECLKLLREDHPDMSVVMLSAKGSLEQAVEAMKLGASDYLSKPFDPGEVIAVLKQAVKVSAMGRENRALKQAFGDSRPRSPFVASAPVMRKLIDDAEHLATLNTTLMITGESGVGKSLLARHIHYKSLRSDKPFVCVSCPALPRELLESELFGHEKGAFTGAQQRRIGRFELAHGGTLFLDEIGDLPLDLQPKLLNVLQDRQVYRIGGSKAVDVDVRVIAATNVDLEAQVAAGEFREDLYYRLNVIPLLLPPLRERPEDIEAIATHVLQRLSRDRQLPDTLSLTARALSLIQSHPWPGNVRQLENALERAAAFSAKDITDDTIRDRALPMEPTSEPVSSDAEVPNLTGYTLRELESHALKQMLEACEGNRAKTARSLGITEKSVYNKLKRLSKY